MIRVCLFSNHAYGYDVTDWDTRESESGFYNSLLEEDLIERVSQGDIIIYFPDKEAAEEWCRENELEYEFVEDDNN